MKIASNRDKDDKNTNAKQETDTGTTREEKWKLRQLQSRLTAEFDFLRRETVQLCQKSFLKPSTDSIDLTESELRFLKESKERNLREIVTKQCSSTIKYLMSQKLLSYPFNEPVNTEMYRDYLNYVQTPMDFGTIKRKLNQYKNPSEFEQDVRLVFENARKYNSPETEVCEMARVLEQKFEEKWNKSVLPKITELKANEVVEHETFKQSKADSVIKEAESRVEECCTLLLKRLHALTEEVKYAQCLAASQCGYVSRESQVRLGWELITLPPEHFQRAANLILTRHPGLVATMKNKTIELNLEKIDSLTFWQLKDFVKECLKESVPEDKSGLDTEHCHDRKRQKMSKSPSDQGATSDYLSTSRQEIHWPRISFGVGLKNYEPETEPFIPITVDDQSLPFSVFFNDRKKSSVDEESKSKISLMLPKESQNPESETSVGKRRTEHKISSSQSPGYALKPRFGLEQPAGNTQSDAAFGKAVHGKDPQSNLNPSSSE